MHMGSVAQLSRAACPVASRSCTPAPSCRTDELVYVFNCSHRHVMCISCFDGFCHWQLSNGNFKNFDGIGFSVACPASSELPANTDHPYLALHCLSVCLSVCLSICSDCDQSPVLDPHHFYLCGEQFVSFYCMAHVESNLAPPLAPPPSVQRIWRKSHARLSNSWSHVHVSTAAAASGRVWEGVGGRKRGLFFTLNLWPILHQLRGSVLRAAPVWCTDVIFSSHDISTSLPSPTPSPSPPLPSPPLLLYMCRDCHSAMDYSGHGQQAETPPPDCPVTPVTGRLWFKRKSAKTTPTTPPPATAETQRRVRCTTLVSYIE